MQFVIPFKNLRLKDIPQVGGKNASLGEMFTQLTKKGLRIPDGFATTAQAYRYFLRQTGLDKKIKAALRGLDIKDIRNLSSRGQTVRQLISKTPLPPELGKIIIKHYRQLSKKYGVINADVAVRSSATAEDLPGASFAGAQESYLNVRGERQLLWAVRACIASLFTDRAIVYREEQGFDHLKIALSVGVQKMVRSDLACSGVMFSCDTESGFADVTVINSSWGLGENIVKGRVNPDEFMVFEPLLKKGYRPIIGRQLGSKEFKLIYAKNKKQTTVNLQTPKVQRQKFTLSDDEVLELTRYSILIEKHYGRPMDVEWAKDGRDKKLYILQARPETVESKRNPNVLEKYALTAKPKTKILIEGLAIGSKIGQGQANVIRSLKEINRFKPGQVLVTKMTDPDWVPVMKMAKAIVTDAGGRTCFSGETKILTDKGFLSIKEIVENHKKENYKVLSLNKETLKIEWQRVVGGIERVDKTIRINFSQSGRMADNFLETTPNHKFLTFHNRKLVAREIKQILQKKEYILSPDYIPSEIQHKLAPELGYFLGGISTDGSIYFKKNHGEIQFIQKPTLAKLAFIKKMDHCLRKLFNYSFHVSVKKTSRGNIRGKLVKGSATAYRCYSKEIAQKVFVEQTRLVSSLLVASEEFIYNFLAGVIDGDGTYSQNANRINIFCSKEFLLQAIIIACLRLNIHFQTTINRGIYNIQMVSGVDKIFEYTSRVKGNYQRDRFGVKFFAAKQLLSDIIESINYQGRIKPYIKSNLLIDAVKIKERLIPMITGQTANHELTRIVNSDLKMLRVNQVEDELNQKVYNITVKKNHNYVIFTKRYTPIVVNNCHAAIISRELGVPCVVGTGEATRKIKSGQAITIDCAEGEIGLVYSGLLPFKIKKTSLKRFRKPRTKIMMNVGEPDQAFGFSFIPNDGVGLAREEFIINNYIGIHPLALINFAKMPASIKRQIEQKTAGYQGKTQFYVDKLAEGIGRIAAAFYPKDVIVRFSDFKTNEYANLIGGKLFEPQEENPMLGWRGASRYYDPKFRDAFRLECLAFKKVREVFGLDNVIAMVPFCRTVEEGQKVLKIMAENGLSRGSVRVNPRDNPRESALKVYVMAEIPSNIILAREFAKIFDGFSIGSNDLTQLTLGLDRDSGLISHIANEKNEAVKILIRQLIKVAHQYRRKVGICGQAPSDFPDFAKFLVKEGIDSISLNPDTVIKTILALKKK